MSEKDDVFDYVMNSPENTNPNVLHSLLDNIPEGGGAGLPDVTTDDNGKVLGVVGGEWAARPDVLFGYIVASGPDTVYLVREDITPVFECSAVGLGDSTGPIFYKDVTYSSPDSIQFINVSWDDTKSCFIMKGFVIPKTLGRYENVTVNIKNVVGVPDTTGNDNGKVVTVVSGSVGLSGLSLLKPKQLSGQYVRAAGNKIMLNGSEVSKDIYDAWNEGTPYRIIMIGDYEYPFEGNDQLILTPSICESGKIYYTGIYHRNGSTSYYKCVFDAMDTSTGVFSTPMTDYTVNDPTTPSEG